MKRERTKFNEKKNLEMTKLEKEKEIWAENLKIVESINCKETDILDMDVGGTQKFSTTRSTLTKVNFTLFSTQLQLWQLCFQEDMNWLNIMDVFSLIVMEIHS